MNKFKNLQVRSLDSKALTERKNDLITRAEEVMNQVKAEKRELTEAEAAELAEIRDDVRKIKEALKLDDDFRELMKDEAPAKPEEKPEEERKCDDDIAKREQVDFEAYVRGVVLNERAANNLTKSNNGAIIPTTIANRIIKKVYDICPILEQSEKYNVKGTLAIPYYNETTSAGVNVAYQNEFAALTSNVGGFQTVNLTGYLAGALSLLSRSLINNVDFDLTGFIVDHMAYAIKRFIEGELLHGTNNKVTGLSTLSNTVTAAATTAVTADEVIKLHDAIKDEYQNGAIWIMSPATRTALRLLKDSMGRYMLQDDLSLPFGTSLLGKPVYVSDNMPNMAAGAKVIYYGNMKGLATKFNEELSIEVLREKYADQHAIGVIGWLEFDAKVQNEQMIAQLQMAAS